MNVRPTLAALLLHAGCARPGPENPPVSEPAWHWEAFPEAQELLIAQLPASFEPVRGEVFRAPAEGRLQVAPEVAAAPTGTVFPAGTVWATFVPTGAAAEDAELERATSTLAARDHRYQSQELPAERIQLDHDIAAAADTLALAELADRDPALFRDAGAPLDPRLLPAAPTAAAAESLRLLKARRAELDDAAAPAEPADLQALRAEVSRRARQRDERRTQEQLKLTFAANLLLTEPAGAGDRPVAAGETLAVTRDWTRVRLILGASRPELHGVASGCLTAAVMLPGGDRLVLPYAFTRVETHAGREEPVFCFEAACPAPPPPVGVEFACTVTARLAQPARIVPKLALAARDRDGALAQGWRGGLVQLFPGTEFVAEGRAALAVRPPAPP